MFGNSSLTAQLAASQELLSSMELVGVVSIVIIIISSIIIIVINRVHFVSWPLGSYVCP
jgi:hypothetical protein